MDTIAHCNGTAAPILTTVEIFTALGQLFRRLEQQQEEILFLLSGRRPVPHFGRAVPRPATVNERMLAILEQDTTRISWTGRRWALALGCSSSTVITTAAWQRIKTARVLERAERTETRSRRP